MDPICRRLDELISYLEPLVPISDSHMVSFITGDLWGKLVPDDIRAEYETHQSTNIFNLFFGESNNNNALLHNFMETASSFYTNSNSSGIFYGMNEFKRHLVTLGCPPSSSLNFDKFMCPKKTHEVEAMSDITAVISRFANVKHIVDIGDGKGYLSSVLALENKFRVLGIDASPGNTLGAAKRVEKMKKHWKGVRGKMDNADEEKLSTEGVVYKQHTQIVTMETDLTEIIQQNLSEETTNCGLVGLHTCGSLSSICLRHFVKNDIFKFIANVGCCYHLIDLVDFPMSNYVNTCKFSLSRNAKMLSLQPISRIVDGKSVQSDPLMYRAGFEHMLETCLGMKGKPRPDVGRISSKCKNFVEYARKACSKLCLTLDMSDEEINALYEDLSAKHESRLQFYFLLRLVVAPAIENAILLDRLLFLVENGLPHSYIVQMFDPVVSPRNYGIVSIKV